MGVQGSGKSTFYRERFFDTHVRLNLDMLKTRHREPTLMTACLTAQQRFVVDNTNARAEQRAVYIQAARAAGFRVKGYWVQAPIQDCLRRNARRPGPGRVPEKGLLGTAKHFEPPELSEGFDALFVVESIEGVGFRVRGLASMRTDVPADN